MAQLAIKGHETHGKEVIKILEMLGGKNSYEYSGNCIETHYYIANEEIYSTRISPINKNIFMCFTLEKFLEKFPYKIGDRVRIPEYESEVCINKMLWNGNEVLYEVVVDDEVERYSAEELNEFNEPNKEETITIDDFKANTKEWLIDKLHDMVISKAIKTIGDIHEELHKPQYPKTYKECCKVLGIDSDNYLSIRNLYLDDGNEETTNYEDDLLGEFDYLWKLTICRKAYWKIAGEQMGLGKPWKPGWLDTNTQKYCIYYVGDEIKKQPMLEVHHFLAFPTKEMSDEFHENFKDLIEQCKELL